MKLEKKQKTALILIGVAVAAYLAYRWYQNRQQNNANSTGLGSNLNSIAPALVAGSAGPSSGLNYYQGDTTVYSGNPVSQPASNGQSAANGSASGSGSGNLPTPVTLSNGNVLTNVQQFIGALRGAGNPSAPVATSANLQGTAIYPSSSGANTSGHPGHRPRINEAGVTVYSTGPPRNG